MSDCSASAAEAVRALNDALRRAFIGGVVVITAGVEAPPVERRESILKKVSEFEAFGVGNDPYGEHDFGAIEESGARFFWKIDAYDCALRFGSPDARAPAVTTRVLTIMRAEEY